MALGIISGISRIVSEEALRKAKVRLPKGTEEINLTAFHVSLEAFPDYKSRQLWSCPFRPHGPARDEYNSM
mgnify:CR=1 FL=1